MQFSRAALLLALVLMCVSSAFAKDELVVIFQKQRDPAQMKAAADRTAQALEEKLHRGVSVQVPSDYSASVQALVSKRADLAYVDSLSYLLAHRDGGATILLGEERVDPKGHARTEYDSVIVVAKDSPLKTFEDIKKSAKDLRVAFTSRTSTSGYLFPYLQLVNTGVLRQKQSPEEVFKSVSFAGSYDLAVKQVIEGKADFAAVSYYSVEGESASKYLKPEELARVRILSRIPGVPTHVIVARGGLSVEEMSTLKHTFLELSKEHPELFKDVYGTSRFVEVNPETHARATEQAVEALGVFPSS